jgi:hypothetical protein
MEDQEQPDRFEELKPKFVMSLRVAGAVLLALALVIAVSYGTGAPLKLDFAGRLVIGIVGFLALVVFAVSGAMLVGERLLNRYSDSRRGDR